MPFLIDQQSRTLPKNKAEKAAEVYMSEHMRTVIPTGALWMFFDNIRKAMDQISIEHPSCKELKVTQWRNEVPYRSVKVENGEFIERPIAEGVSDWSISVGNYTLALRWIPETEMP